MAGVRFQQRGQLSRSARSKNGFDHPILVVQDQESIAQYVAAMIKEHWDCEVVVASNMQAARDALSSVAPAIQVAICDLNLPDAHHGEVIDLMNEHGVAPIVLTGAFGDAARETVIKEGVVDFIQKDSINAYEYAVKLAGRVQKNAQVSVLIVDDSPDALADYKNMCELLWFKVFTASNGKEALHVLKQHPEITLMLTDHIMPGMDGFELTAKARSMFSMDRLAIIGISAATEEEISINFLKCGANDYLANPFSYQEFLCRIHQNLDMLDIIRANQEAAQCDFMTRLYNRRHFFALAGPIHANAKKDNSGLTAAVIDLDSVKSINDKYGHDCGDVVIQHFASLLEKRFGTNLVARIGGEEFAVLLTDALPPEVRKRFEDLRLAVKNSTVDCGTEKISYTISIGLSDRTGENIDDLLKEAGIALYQAKAGKRDQICGLD
ncbi:Response regulator PleD [Gallionellaceae bacterium]|nr:Response regulator PleD [Gallionellaceae bacterium]